MKLYNFYLARKITSYFLVTVSTLILLIWFAKAVSFISFVTEKGVSFISFANLFILILPWLFLIIIPVSLFLAIIIAYNQMISHNEIVVLKNAGLDNLKLARPAISIAIICCLICYLISFFLMPYANKKLRTTKNDFRNNYVNLVITPKIFETLGNLTIYVQNRDNENQLSGILIYDKRNPEYSSTITAQSGILNQSGSTEDALLLYLNHGTAQRFNYKTHKSDILNFDSYVINLGDNNKAQENFSWKASERYINELLNPGDEASLRDLRNYYVELHQRITYPLLSIILTLIATATILSSKFNRRGNLMHTLKATLIAAIFISLFMSGYNLIGASSALTPLIYLNLLFFVVYSFYSLKPKK